MEVLGNKMAQEMMNNRTPLDRAIRNEHTEIAELLIAKGTDVNAKSNRGYTPLHEACKNEKTEILELLIAKGADVNAKDDDGDTPLDYAHRLNIPKSPHSSANTAPRGVKS